MSPSLNLAQNHAPDLARILMVPVKLFRTSGEYGVLPTVDIDDTDNLKVIHEFDPWSPAR